MGKLFNMSFVAKYTNCGYSIENNIASDKRISLAILFSMSFVCSLST